VISSIKAKQEIKAADHALSIPIQFFLLYSQFQVFDPRFRLLFWFWFRVRKIVSNFEHFFENSGWK